MTTQKKIWFLTAAILTVFFFASNAPASGVADYTLPNGMKVILIQNNRAPVTSMLVWVNVGSKDEMEGEYGMAHILEHMLFKGTTHRAPGEIAKEVESSGGRINAYTSFDQTVYYIDMASRYTERGLDVLSDMVFNATIAPEEFTREKEVVIEEIKRGMDDPGRKLSQAVFRNAFQRHPYGRPIIGYQESVRAFTRDSTYEFYKKWYKPNNMVLVVSGDFDSDEIKPVIEQKFGQAVRETIKTPDITAEPRQREARAEIIKSDVKATQLQIAFHIPGFSAGDTKSVDMLAEILGSGRTSRLYSEVKNNLRLVHNIYAGAYTPEDPGLFLIGMELEPENVQKALAAVFEEINKIKENGVTAEEMNRAKLGVKAYFIRSRATMSGEARTAANFESLAGDYRGKDAYISGIEQLSSQDVVNAAVKYLRPESVTIGLLTPEKSQVNLSETDLIESSAVLTGAAEEKNEPASGGFVETRLSNGARLLIKQDHSLPLVSLRAAFLGGVRYETIGNNGINNFLAMVWDKGTKDKNAEELARALEDMAASVSSFSGRNSFGLEADFLSQYLDESLTLFTEVLTQPRIDSAEVERQRPVILAAIKRQQDEMSARTFKLFSKTIYQGSPYALDMLGTSETVEAIKTDDIREYYDKWVRPSNMVLSIVGDVDPEAVQARLEELLKGWNGKASTPPEINLPDKWEGVRKAEDVIDRAQAHLILGFPAPGLKSEDKYSLEVLDNVLSGQGGRLFIELRDKKSLGYTVTSFYSHGLGTGSFGFYIAFDPAKVNEARDGFGAVIEEIKKNGVSDKELEGAKENLLGTFDIALQSYEAQASQAAFNDLYGLGVEYPETYVEKINAVTKEDVVRAARRYLNMDQAVEVIVGRVN